jgi:signal transduction histidine kinase
MTHRDRIRSSAAGSLRRRLVLTVIVTTAVVVAVAAAAAWFASARLRYQAAESALRNDVALLMPRLLARQWLAQREGRQLPELVPQTLPDDQWRALVAADGQMLSHTLPAAPDAGWVRGLPPSDGRVRRRDDPLLGPVLMLVADVELHRTMARRMEAEREGRRDGQGDGEPSRPSRPPRDGEAPPRRLPERLAPRNEQRVEALLAWIERLHPQLVVVHPLRDIDHELQRQAWLLAGMWVLACALVAAVVLVITGRILAPLRRLTDSIAGIAPGNPGQVVAVEGLVRELAPVQERLNDLLQRVDAVLAREQQTTANIAHELRTPLAGLRAKLELALQRQRDPLEIAGLCREALATMTPLQGLVDNLLLLTRLEAGQERPHRQAMELAEVVAGAWALHQPAAESRGLTLARDIEPALSLDTDGDKLRAILANLLGNAAAHADPGGVITLDAHEDATTRRVLLTIANRGATIGAQDVERVFEPFWRGDGARTVDRGHCGLGLPLVRRLATVLGGTVAVTVDDGWFRIHLELPTAPRAGAHAAG